MRYVYRKITRIIQTVNLQYIIVTLHQYGIPKYLPIFYKLFDRYIKLIKASIDLTASFEIFFRFNSIPGPGRTAQHQLVSVWPAKERENIVEFMAIKESRRTTGPIKRGKGRQPCRNVPFGARGCRLLF